MGEDRRPDLEVDLPDDFEESEATVVTDAFSGGSFFGDRFRIDRTLGIGGMGSVYAATDFNGGEIRVALKVLKDKAKDSERRLRFQREAQILQDVHHPGIVSIHAFGHAPDGTPWIAMELLDGETLRERVNRFGPMEPDEVAPLLSAAADALGAAHAKGVIHRDLKPDNLYLPRRGAVLKILDFGLSLSIGAKKLTKTGSIIGTPRYMSPEQIASAHAADARTDVYALGVIAYEAMTGQSPFIASDHGQLLGAILQGRMEPLTTRRPDLPASLEAVLLKATAKDPADRFQTPQELAAAFADAAGVRPSMMTEFRFSEPEPAARIKRSKRSKRGWGFWAIALFAITALAVGALSAVGMYHLMR